MSVWENDKKTLEGQGRQQACYKNGNMTWSDCVRGPIRIKLAWTDCTAEGQANPTTIQVCDSVRRPILGVYILLPSKAPYERANRTSEACI